MTLIVDQLGRSGVVAAQWGVWGGGVGGSMRLSGRKWGSVRVTEVHWGSLKLKGALCESVGISRGQLAM